MQLTNVAIPVDKVPWPANVMVVRLTVIGVTGLIGVLVAVESQQNFELGPAQTHHHLVMDRPVVVKTKR